MIRFIEKIKFDTAFAKSVYDAFYDSEKEKLDFYGKRYKVKFAGWPEGLDMENFEIDGIGGDFIVFLSGGDWQELVPVKLCLKRDSRTLVWSPFDSYTRKSRAEIKLGCRDLINCVQGQMAEDCQIAGPVMGDLPQNVGGTLSPGYKSGRVLPPPGKRTGSKDFDSIPYF
jgi:hypothetical protein